MFQSSASAVGPAGEGYQWRVHVCPLRTLSLFTVALWVSWTQYLLSFRSRCFRELSPRYKSEKLGHEIRGLNLSLLMEALWLLSHYMLMLVCPNYMLPRIGYDKIAPHPLLPIFSVKCMWATHSAHFWISFRGKNLPFVAVDLVCPW